MERLRDAMEKVISKYFPDMKIKEIIDKGVGIKHTFKIILHNNKSLYVKINIHPEWTSLQHEKTVTQMLLDKGLSAPNILAIDTSNTILPYSYLIQEEVKGEKLMSLLLKKPKEELINIYEAMGKYYSKMHSITNDSSGIWHEDPKKLLYSISPNDYMFREEILNGSGKRALEEKIITEEVYNKIVSLWEKNLDYLKAHQPTLINVSSFIWNIYLNKESGVWSVTKLMSLGDVIWWDPSFEIALLRYPPFYKIDESIWGGFIKAYGSSIEEKRILLYSTMQKLCAIMGVYMEPSIEGKEKWINRQGEELIQHIRKLEVLG